MLATIAGTSTIVLVVSMFLGVIIALVDDEKKYSKLVGGLLVTAFISVVVLWGTLTLNIALHHDKDAIRLQIIDQNKTANVEILEEVTTTSF